MIKRYYLLVERRGYEGEARLVPTADGDWVRYEDHAAEVERLRADRARVAEMERAFDLLQGWTNRYDNELCPPAGYADTYGDGMRSAKQGVKTFCITTLATLRAEEGGE